MTNKRTGIAWTEVTWNPTTGCDRVSPGCDHCYAMAMSARLKAMGAPAYQNDGKPPRSGPGFGLTLQWDRLTEPLRWQRPRLVFVNSMSDLFHSQVPTEFIQRVLDVCGQADIHTFQILTKRAARLAKVAPLLDWPTNVWMGVSVESDEQTSRVHALRALPSHVTRWVSAEPLIGPVHTLPMAELDWIVVGGESGPGARPMEPEWVSNLSLYAELVDTAYFFKQWGTVAAARLGYPGKGEHLPVYEDRTRREYPSSHRHTVTA